VTGGFSLRRAVAADVGDIVRLVRGLAEYEKLLHEVESTEADFRERLFGASPVAHAVLAEADGAAVGMALYYYTFSTFTGRCDLFLEDLFVMPTYRGLGIGLALFRHLAGIARDERCRRIEWRVLNWNQPAIDFYRRIGAQPMTEWSVQRLEGAALAALAD
jgi:GNAT superfamily N-acetyltransferase